MTFTLPLSELQSLISKETLSNTIFPFNIHNMFQYKSFCLSNSCLEQTDGDTDCHYLHKLKNNLQTHDSSVMIWHSISSHYKILLNNFHYISPIDSTIKNDSIWKNFWKVLCNLGVSNWFSIISKPYINYITSK